LFLPADDLVSMHSKLGGDLIDRYFSPVHFWGVLHPLSLFSPLDGL
jgi:hypothetical protein